MRSLAFFNGAVLRVVGVVWTPTPLPPGGHDWWMLSERRGLLLGRRWGPQLATSGDLYLATSGDFYMATDMVETLSGGTWTATTVATGALSPAPANDPAVFLFGPSCPSLDSCVATGKYTDVSGHTQG
ncbi:MAG: hypothetical protein ACYC1D_01085 [Acidimicrobiales bacterium]